MSNVNERDKPQDFADCMPARPQQEHEWLHRLVGEWSYEGECLMGPDQPPMKSTGTQSTTSLGGLWVVGDGHGTMPDGSPATTRMTLGYDPQKQRFVGSFIGSMMTHQWLYLGTLDEGGRVLTLDSDGPDFADPAKTAKYQDIIEIRDEDHHVLSSRTIGPDGQWQQFMTAHYRRAR